MQIGIGPKRLSVISPNRKKQEIYVRCYRRNHDEGGTRGRHPLGLQQTLVPSRLLRCALLAAQCLVDWLEKERSHYRRTRGVLCDQSAHKDEGFNIYGMTKGQMQNVEKRNVVKKSKG